MVVMAEPAACAREHQAGAHRHAVEQHGAGAADAVLAAGMRALEAEQVAQAIEQRGARLDLELVQRAVDVELNAHGLCSLAHRRSASATARAASTGGDAAAIGGGGVQIVERLDVGERVLDRARAPPSASSVPPVNCCSALSSRIGMIGRRADADGDAFASCRRPSSTCAAAETKAKSLRRAFTSWKPMPTLARARPESARRSDTRRPAALVIIGPTIEIARRDLGGLAAGAIAQAWHRASPRSATISAAGSALASEPPMVPRARVAAWPMLGMARANSGTLAATSASRSTTHCRVVAPMATPSPSLADIGQGGDAVDVDQPGRAREPHRHHRHQRLPAGDHARAVVGGEQRAGFVDVGRRGNTRTVLLS